MCYRIVQFALVLSFSIAIQQRDKSSAKTSVGDTTRPTDPPAWGTLIGSTESNKYHRPQCAVAKKIRPENTIWFTDAIDATENGYVPAGCRGRDCQPPLAPAQIPLGELGGAVLPPPDPNPPAIPTSVIASSANAKPKLPPARAIAKPSPAQVRTPPPRMPPARETTASQVWTGVTPDQELEARRRWDVWAEWALDRWCDRWHVSASGRINSDSAYTQTSEQFLLGKLKAMKEQIEDNKKRMRELRAMLEGKKK